jgi:hypothetical protein
MSFNALKFLQDYDVRYYTEGKNCAPGWINIDCDFCNDNDHHGGFNIESGIYNCWRCGTHKTEEVIKEVLGISYNEAREIREEYDDGMLYKQNFNKNKLVQKDIILPGTDLKEMHRRYLMKRNFDPDYIIKKYRIQGTGIVGKWKYRIIIPIYYQHRLVSFQGRDITNKQTYRYKTLSKKESGFDLGTTLYCIDECKRNYIGVVEGCFDRWRMKDDFVCCLTSDLTDNQIMLLSKYEKVYFLFDPEKEAYEKAKKISKKLNVLGIRTYVVSLDIGKDPAELSDDKANDFRKEMGFK